MTTNEHDAGDATGSCLRHPLWYQRLYAWLLSGENALYDTIVASRKRELFGSLSGTVLELGPGSGVNIPYLRCASHWIGVEPNPYFHRRIRRTLRRLGVSGEIRPGLAERIPAPDASVDAVIATLVLCSVNSLPDALREIRRVLRPGGEFCFLEHVAAPEQTGMRAVQRAVRPLWKTIAGGCLPDRETWKEIERAGFVQCRIDHFKVAIPITAPHIAGRARRGAT